MSLIYIYIYIYIYACVTVKTISQTLHEYSYHFKILLRVKETTTQKAMMNDRAYLNKFVLFKGVLQSKYK